MRFEIKNLSDVVFFREGPGVRKFQFRDRGVKLLNVGNINNGVLDTSTTKLYISEEEAYGKYKHFLVAEGDLLIASSGIVVANFHNKIAYAKKEHLPLCLNTSTIRFKSLDANSFTLDYLKFFLKTNHFKNQLKKLITGAAQLNFGPSHLKKIKIPVPVYNDQLHIANLLSKAENLIAQRKESIRLLDEFLKSTFLEMFGEVSCNKKKFDKVGLKYFGEIITGNTPSRKNPDNYSSNYIEWIKTDNITADNTYVIKAVEYLSERGLKSARTANSGSLLVACIAGSIESVGRAALTDRTVSFNQQINAIQPKKEVEPLYLYWLFKISKKYIQNHASKGMKKILTKGEFEKVKMIKPPLELQTKFAQIVEKTETLKAQYKQSLQELENLYGSMSQKAFRGELSVNKKASV